MLAKMRAQIHFKPEGIQLLDIGEAILLKEKETESELFYSWSWRHTAGLWSPAGPHPLLFSHLLEDSYLISSHVLTFGYGGS